MLYSQGQKKIGDTMKKIMNFGRSGCYSGVLKMPFNAINQDSPVAKLSCAGSRVTHADLASVVIVDCA